MSHDTIQVHSHRTYELTRPHCDATLNRDFLRFSAGMLSGNEFRISDDSKKRKERVAEMRDLAVLFWYAALLIDKDATQTEVGTQKVEPIQ